MSAGCVLGIKILTISRWWATHSTRVLNYLSTSHRPTKNLNFHRGCVRTLRALYGYATGSKRQLIRSSCGPTCALRPTKAHRSLPILCCSDIHKHRQSQTQTGTRTCIYTSTNINTDKTKHRQTRSRLLPRALCSGFLSTVFLKAVTTDTGFSDAGPELSIRNLTQPSSSQVIKLSVANTSSGPKKMTDDNQMKIE